jgi:hypothetical protein
MKIVINPANTHNGIVIEGTVAELEPVITLLLNSATPLPSVAKSISSLTAASKQVVSSTTVPNAMEFISSIYVYNPNPNSMHGRGRYIAELIASGATCSINQVAKKAKAQPKAVTNAIKRMQKAGAEFVINGDNVLLIRVPNKKYAPARRSDFGKPNRKRSHNLKNNSAVLASISGKKIK